MRFKNLLLLLISSYQMKINYCSSIALENNSSALGDGKFPYLYPDPFGSMEDLASKEKFIINATTPAPTSVGGPLYPPTTTQASAISEEEEQIKKETDPIDSTEMESLENDTSEAEPDSDELLTTDEVEIDLDSNEMVTLKSKTTSHETDNELTYTPPLPIKSQIDEDIDEKLFLILQNSVRETYFSFRDILGKRHRDQLQRVENELRSKISKVDVDLNVKVVALDTTTHSRIQTLTDKIIDQRKEDIQTFSDNLHQLQKTHQMHIDSQKVEIQQLQVTMDLLNKQSSTLSTKMSQLQKTVNNLDSKVNEMVIKTSEDLGTIQDTQKTLSVLVDEIEKDLRTSEAELEQMQGVVSELEKAATEDHGKLRRTLIRDQKQEPIQNSIRHLRNKNIGAALKHWRAVEAITDDLKETLPVDMSKIIDESYGKNAANLPTILEFIHRAVSHGDRRLKEAAYASLLQDMDPNKQLTDQKKTHEVFNLAQTMKSDLGNFYNTSSTTADIVNKLPEIIKLITFDKVKILLPTRGYLRVAADRKVTLVPQDGRFYDKDEILWQFEYDKDKSDGTFYIKSDKLQKYLVTLHEGFNSYGFSKQGLFVTGGKKDNGTRFQLTIVNNGEYVLFKSVFYKGFLSWKSNIQTIYGDDDSYFLLLVDRKNGPSPYWHIQAEND